MFEKLNEGQKAAYSSILRGDSTFITGPGGTGKSYLLNLVYKALKNSALTALTGCAAHLLHPKAKTIHSWAGIGLGKDPISLIVHDVRKSRKACVRWLSTDVLIIDEVSMMTPELFEILDQVGREIRKCPSPFGGIQLVLVGDFYQLPPISEGTTKFVFESPLWQSLKLVVHDLTEIVRQKDLVFQTVLNEARVGQLSKKSLRILSRRMGLSYKEELIRPTMLFTRRAQVDQINMKFLRELTTERKIYKATTLFDPGVTATEKDPLVERVIEKLDYGSSYSGELILAIGAQVMLLTNLKPEEGLVNGSRGVIVGFEGIKDKEIVDPSLLLPVVRFRNGIERLITHTTWESTDMPGVKRRQIPLKLAYAITIHKSQGATLDCVLIDVGSRTFECGQAYVALSRVKDLESLYIHALDPAAFRAHPTVTAFYTQLREGSHVSPDPQL